MAIKYYNNKPTDQVFISFRGKDERYTFVSHLKQKLIDGKVNVFTDEDIVGQPLQNLLEEIRKSRIIIVVISKNFTDSAWCLKELVEIKKCKETNKAEAVIPIFYEVKVSAVKQQSGEFGKKLSSLQNSLLAQKGITKENIELVNSTVKGWKEALRFVAGMGGLRYHKNSSEAAFVELILEKAKTSYISEQDFFLKHVILKTESDDLEHPLRRIASYLDNTSQYRPFALEGAMVPKRPTFLSCLRYSFEFFLSVIFRESYDAEQRMIQQQMIHQWMHELKCGL